MCYNYTHWRDTVKTKYGFYLTAFSVVGFFGLAWFKDVDINNVIPAVLSIYILGRTATNVSATWAASKDPSADTQKAIDTVIDKE